jgi:hypothetical protein
MVVAVSTPNPSAVESADSVPGMDCSDISALCSTDSEAPAIVNSDSDATILTSYAANIMASSISSLGNFSIVTFNMHGYNQGFDAVNEIICTYEPSCILLQEHWLTPAVLHKLDVFSDYFAIGTSAMCDAVESSAVFGRPFGGVAVLVHKRFATCCSVICTGDRVIALLVNDLVIVNVYLPC